jgi:CRISPR type III-A-associated RAMP protein Csm4
MTAAQQPGMVVKLRPTGPWRVGPDSGARDAVDLLYHSDSLYSAVTGAMRLLGHLDEWLDATARRPDGAAVRFSSLFPFQNEVGFVVPPRSVWPPPASTKVRWKGARFVPLGLIRPLLSGQTLEEDRWDVDGVSQCLVPGGRLGPFRVVARSAAAMDRLAGNIEPHDVACVVFLPGAGLWAVISFSDDEQKEKWDSPLRAALRWLADSGLGGERGRGWGRAETPEFIEGTLPQMILPDRTPEPATTAEGETPAPAEAPAPEPVNAYWLLSLFCPGAGDSVDWNRGSYAVVARAGRVDSPVRSGDAKKALNMITEGSVLLADHPVQGAAPDVAPDGFAHPVYRAGFALAIPIPGQVVS